ncbi:MAG TPA: 50S ribosomal protein L4 [Candidatus Methylomirabilis sp.]|nr:50S ribosomal protein L4 [Candidatus Methylomirabilis sp.]
MPKVSMYNQDGKQTGELELSVGRFGVKVNPAVVHEAVVAQQANARRAIANTKTRGEVRGGGKKPWKQKGTGRARAGSSRSPIWVGGGITFGPRSERNFAKKINKKTKQKALFMALSDKVANGNLVVLESFTPKEPKTKEMVGLMKRLPVKRSALYVIAQSNPVLVRMARNIQTVHVVTANSVNLVDVMKAGTLVFEKSAVSAFEKIHPGVS